MQLGRMYNVADVVLTDDQKKQQPLLETLGIIIAPENIDFDAYLQLSWALALARFFHPDRILELRCHGSGGLVDAGFAIADLICADGNVDGIALGDVASAHTYLWTACARRYVYPNARFSYHPVATGAWSVRLEAEDFERTAKMTKWENKRVLQMYADASAKSLDWWRKKYTHGGYTLEILNAQTLIDIGMAQPIRERMAVDDHTRAMASDVPPTTIRLGMPVG